MEAAPRVVLRVLDQAANYRVSVHVHQLLDTFVFSEDVEVVVAALPELVACSLETL